MLPLDDRLRPLGYPCHGVGIDELFHVHRGSHILIGLDTGQVKNAVVWSLRKITLLVIGPFGVKGSKDFVMPGRVAREVGYAKQRPTHVQST